MSAIITTTSQAVELQIVNNGKTLQTTYPATVEAAYQMAQQLGVCSIEFEELSI